MNHSNEIEFLKWIGIFSMILDHIGVVLPQYEILRIFGRLAFPIFGFVLIYNFSYHTRNKVHYIKRIAIFSIISEPIHFLFFHNYYSEFNIFFMYTLGLFFLFFYELTNLKNIPFKQKIFLLTIFSIISIYISQYIEYGIDGFLLVISYYFMLKSRYFIIFTITFLIFLNTSNIIFILYSSFSLLLIYLVLHINIKVTIPRYKYFFYIFYPFHMLVIWTFNHFFIAKAETIAKSPGSGDLLSIGMDVSAVILFLLVFVYLSRKMAKHLASASLTSSAIGGAGKAAGRGAAVTGRAAARVGESARDIIKS